MALALYDRVKETTTTVGTGSVTLLGASTGFQSFAVVGNGNTTYYCIADQGGPNWEVGIGTYSSSGNTLTRTTVLSSSNADALVAFTAGIKDVFVTYPSSKGLWKDASGNAIGLGTPAAFVGTNITGTASGLTAGNVTTNANLTGAITSVGNATSLGSFTSANLAAALTNETGSGSAVFSDNASLLNPTYTGTLTGSTGILNIGSGQVYKDASGNVGIGTSSPSTTLHVKGGGNPILKLETSGNVTTGGYNYLTFWDSSNLQTGFIGYGGVANLLNINNNLTNGSIVFNTGASYLDRMRIDSLGNVGIGVIPSASTTFPALEIGGGNCIFGSANSFVDYTYNAYYNGAYRYKTTGYASYYEQASGSHRWFNAPSGTAGNAIGFTQSMTLDASGNLLVGTTAQVESCRLSLYGGSIGGLGFASSLVSNKYSVSIDSAGGLTTRKDSVDFWYLGRSGSLNCVSSGGSWVNSSDARLKDNIQTLPHALENVLKLRGVTFIRKATQQQEIGVVAQEISVVYPEAVEDSNDMLGVNYGALVGPLIEAIKELKAIIDTQQEQINSLLGK